MPRELLTMICKTEVFAIICMLITFSSSHPATAQEVSVVMVQGNEIYANSNGGQFVRLTNDGKPKTLPVWSKDGTKIAFVENTSKNVAVASLSVIDRTGGLISVILI